ncbi:nitrogen fixation protein FixH [Stella humosa]|uniref:Nitrogen fixation protein FixH n=1 Tax=Stella humosa TaxID=94 RepID=A0A3N1KPY2_9PROT|nr:FixH family protein [Stella humosa]ROP81347.1 nitrogen fixation protein FixH [Stella humosa]BBK32697.1 membrane protein [Stella humosa]
MTMLATPAPAPRRSWIPWIYAGGMLVVVAVNAGLITAAISTFPGLSVDRPYERGIAYNRILAMQARQDRLGWTGTATIAGTAEGGRELGGRELVVTLRDRDGRALDGARMQGRLDRPLENDAAVVLQFQPRANGTFAAPLDGLRPGLWQATLDGRREDGNFRMSQRLVLP